MATLAKIAATIGDIAKIAAGVQQVAAILNTARSVVLQVENHTAVDIKRVNDSHAHGGWAQPPSSQIDAGTVEIFGSQSDSWSIATGTEGTVTYDYGNNIFFVVSWNNPFLGSNDCSASVQKIVLGAGPFGFRITPVPELTVFSTCGNQNTGAIMRYELRPTPPV